MQCRAVQCSAEQCSAVQSQLFPHRTMGACPGMPAGRPRPAALPIPGPACLSKGCMAAGAPVGVGGHVQQWGAVSLGTNNVQLGGALAVGRDKQAARAQK
jgi:hypothetical protein